MSTPNERFERKISSIKIEAVGRTPEEIAKHPPISGELTLSTDIWKCLPETIAFLIWTRDNFRAEKAPHYDLYAGLNYSIILNACCLFEGALEGGLIRLRDSKSTETRDKIHESDIRRARGLEHYEQLFRELTGTNLSDLPKVARKYEGIKSLFKLRNRLAHGRAKVVTIHHKGELGEEIPLDASRGDIDRTSTYDSLDNYLVKRNLITDHLELIIESPNECYLSDKVANHFAVLVFEALAALVSNLPKEHSAILEKSIATERVLTETSKNILGDRRRNARQSSVYRVAGISVPGISGKA